MSRSPQTNRSLFILAAVLAPLMAVGLGLALWPATASRTLAALGAGLLVGLVSTWVLANRTPSPITAPRPSDVPAPAPSTVVDPDLTALQPLVLALAGCVETRDVGRMLAAQAVKLLQASSGIVYGTDDATRHLHRLASHGPAFEAGGAAEATSGLAARAAGQHAWLAQAVDGSVITVPDSGDHASTTPGLLRGLAMPLDWQAGLIGVLEVAWPEGHSPSEREYQVAQHLAAEAGTALGNARLYAAAGRQAERLVVLHGASQAISQSLDLEQVYRATYAAVGQLMPNDAFAISLLNERGSQIDAVYLVDRGERKPSVHFGLDVGVAGHMLRVGQPLLFRTADDWPVTQVRFGSGGPIQSGLAVPMQAGDRVFGVLAAESYAPNAYTEADIPLLATLANQAASAIQNARLYQSVHRQVTELSLLSEIAMAVVSAPGVDNVVTRAVQVLHRRLGLDSLGVLLLDEAGNRLRLHPSYMGDIPVPKHVDLSVEQGVTGEAARTGHAVRVDDVSQHPAYIGVDPRTRSELAIPLKVADRVIGVLNTESHRTAAYLEADERLLTVVAGLLAPVIENARLRSRAEQQAADNTRLYEAARRRADQMRLVNEVGRDVAGILDVESLLSQVARRLETAFGYYHAELGLIEGEAVAFGAYRDERVGRDLPAQRMPLSGPGVIAWAARHSSPRYVPDVALDREYILSQHFPATKSEAAVPLVAHGQTIGVLDIQTDVPVQFGAEDAAVLEAIAGQLAVAVTNARLFAEVRQRAAEVAGLLTTTLAVSSSLDLAERLQSIALHARALIEGDVCTIYRISADGQRLLPLVALDEHYAQEILQTVIPVGDGLIGYVASSGIGELINRADLDPRAKHIAGTPMTPESLVAVPLMAGAQLIGVMAVYREGTREFTPHHFDLLTSFAAQAAVAIENAELYQTLRERAESLEATYNELAQMDRLKDEMVQNISHELRTPLTFLKSYVDLMLGGDLGPLLPDQLHGLTVIQSKTESLVRLVNDIITLQAVGPATIRRVPADLRALAWAAVDGVSVVAREAGVEVVAHLPDTPVDVNADILRLSQVFDNLLGNAVKFTPRGGRIDVNVSPQTTVVRVEVRDTGIGIDAEFLDRIFDRFYQVDGTLTRKRGGIGLGLSISKLIVEAHGGHIGVQSQPGAGSCFFFELPWPAQAAVPAGATPAS